MSILPNLNAARVLIVEEDLVFAERATRLLSQSGYYVQNAYNVGDALFAIENTRFDLVLINSTMRDRTGRPVSDYVDSHPAFRGLQTMVFGDGSKSKRDNNLPRPTTDEDLLKQVAGFVRGRKRQTGTYEGDQPARPSTPPGSTPLQSQPRTAEVAPRRTSTGELAQDARFQQQYAELKTLSTLGRSLSSSLELSDVLNQIVDAATSLTHAEEGLLLLPDEAGAALYIRAMKGLDSESARNFRIKTDDTLAGRVFTSGEPILIGAQGWQKVKTEYFVRSLLYVPLSYKDVVIGVLGVNNKRAERVFTAHDQDLLLDLAAYATIALANARLYEKQVMQTRQLTTLVEAGRAVNSTLALDGVLSTICQQIIHALNVSGCVISDLGAGANELHALAMTRRAVWPSDQGPTLILADRPMLKSAMDQNAYYDVSRERSGTMWLSERDALNRSGAATTIVLPLLPSGQALGVLELHYLGDVPEITGEFRRQARALAIEISVNIAQRTTASTSGSAFVQAQSVLKFTGANWFVLSLMSGAGHLTRALEFGDAVWLGEMRPQEIVFPPFLSDFERSDTLVCTSRDERLPPAALAAFTAYGASALLGVCLRVKGTPIGAMTIYDASEARRFSAEEISLAQAIGLQAATAIENARLFHDLDNSLTELKATQIRLVQAARLSAMGELSAAVAHQINNPLTTVLAETEMLLQDMPEGDPQQEAVAAVHRAGKRAHTVVRRLLSTARRGSIDDRPEAIDVNDTIHSTLELVTSHITRGRVNLQVDLEDRPMFVSAIAGQLEDVWLNLLLNAHDAVLGVHNPTVMIASRLETDRVQVSVIDNGQGIAAENQSQIFEPFFTTKPSGEGTGLGLYICKQVVDSIGGRIELFSEVNHGTRFVIDLPLYLGEPEER